MKPIWALLACLVLYVPGFVAVTQPEPQKGQSVDRNQIPNWPYKPDGSRVYSDSGPVRLCMLDGHYVGCNKVPLPWKDYMVGQGEVQEINWQTKKMECDIQRDNTGDSEFEICLTKDYDETEHNMFKTYGEKPFDVPPVMVRSQTYTLEDLGRGDIPGRETCADKTRFLLHSEDGKGHCLRLLPHD